MLISQKPKSKSKSINIKIKNMINTGFYIEIENKKVYPPLHYLTAKTKDDMYVKITNILDSFNQEDINTVVIGTVGYNDLENAIARDGNSYKAVLAFCGVNQL